jgi:hypothetical protein
MIRKFLIAVLTFLAAPALAQAPLNPSPWSNEVDPAAILSFDPDGASGIALTISNVRAYLAKSVAPPPKDAASMLDARRTAAKAAKTEILADPNLLTPLWSGQAFKLQNGSVRAMSEREKAVFTKLETLDAMSRSTSAQRELSMALPGERARLTEAIVLLLQDNVRMNKWTAVGWTDGYRKVEGKWVWFDYEGGEVATSHPATPEVENTLLRYELAVISLENGVLEHKLNPATFEAMRGPVQ